MLGPCTAALHLGRKHLPRIQNSVRIERPAQFPHHAHLGITRERGQKTFLRQADAMFPRNRAAEPDGFGEDFLEGFLDAVHLVFVPFVGEKGGVQIYSTALRCADNKDLNEDWNKYLEQTKTHVQVVSEILRALDRGAAPPK